MVMGIHAVEKGGKAKKNAEHKTETPTYRPLMIRSNFEFIASAYRVISVLVLLPSLGLHWALMTGKAKI